MNRNRDVTTIFQIARGRDSERDVRPRLAGHQGGDTARGEGERITGMPAMLSPRGLSSLPLSPSPSPLGREGRGNARDALGRQPASESGVPF